MPDPRDPPLKLAADPETRLEWEKWVGREVIGPGGAAAEVIEIRRRSTVGALGRVYAHAEAWRQRDMQGANWLALIRWTDKCGGLCSDLRGVETLKLHCEDARTRLISVS